MAWKKYTPPVSNGPAPVSLTIQEKDSRGRPFVSIDAATLKTLGWKPGASLQLSIGEGEHDGKIRIEPMTGEPTTLRAPSPKSKAKRSRVNLGRMPGLADDAIKTACSFAIEREALIVTLPNEARGHRLPPGTARAVATAQASSPFARK